MNEINRMSTPKEDSVDGKQKDVVRLVFLGSPLLDITAHCDQSTLDKYGLKPDDCVRATDGHDQLFEQLFNDSGSRLDAGGSAFNSAKISKWILGEKGHVLFAGCVGIDNFASELRSDLQKWDVEPLFVPLPDKPTGVCVCLLSSGGTRSMCTRHGAAAHFNKGHLMTEDIQNKLAIAHCVFVVGYFAAHSPEVIRALAGMCSPSQLFSISLSAEYICRDYSSVLLDVLPRVDILVGNEAEVKAFATAVGLKEGITVEDAACAFAKMRCSPSRRPRIVVITRGSKPVIFVRGNEAPRYFSVPQNVHVLDSVGCGDALAGAFVSVYTLTGEEHQAVEAGIQAAVKIAQVPGCSLPCDG